jgi:hypothetical protein
MRFSSALVAVLSSVLTAHAANAPKPTSRVVDLRYAKYEGSVNDQTGNFNFLGMRFAAPPTGSSNRLYDPFIRERRFLTKTLFLKVL